MAFDELVAPESLHEFRQAGAEFDQLVGQGEDLVDTNLKAATMGAALLILGGMKNYADGHPDIEDFYRKVLGYDNETDGGTDVNWLELQDEAESFRDIFGITVEFVDESGQPESKNPKSDFSEAITFDGIELTREEDLVELVHLLVAEGPISALTMRAKGLDRFIGSTKDSTTPERTKLLEDLLGRLVAALSHMPGDIKLDHVGQRVGKKYFLTLGDTEVRRVDIPKPKVLDQKQLAVDAIPDPITTQSPAPLLPPTPELSAEIPPLPGQKIVVRGNIFDLTILEYRILQAVLAGNNQLATLVPALYNGKSHLDEAELSGVLLPAIHHLCQVDIGLGQKLLNYVTTERGISRRITVYSMAPGARFETERRSVHPILRLQDPRSHGEGLPTKNDSVRTNPVDNSRSTSHDRQETRSHRPLSANRSTRPQTVNEKAALQPIIVANRQFRRGDKDVTLDRVEMSILELLSAGQRLTVADIANAVRAEGADMTFTTVIGEILMKLQTKLSADRLRRKQKSGQPTRWWITPGSIVLSSPSDNVSS